MDWSNAVEVKSDIPSIDWSNAVEVKSTLPDALVNSPTDTKPIDTTGTLVDQNFGSSNGTDNGTVPSTENGQTIPTKLALDMPGNYASDKAIQDEIQKRQEQSAINQTTYKDPVTGQTQLPPQEPGMQDESLAVTPIGKLSILPKALPINAYDVLGNSLLSDEAKLLLKLNQNRISEVDAIRLLKDIPKKDQVIALASRLDLGKNYFSTAVGQDSILAGKLGRRLEQRKNIIEPYIANEPDLLQAQKTFGEMRKQVDTQVPNVIDTSSLQESIAPLTEYYKTDPSPIGSTIRNISLDLSEPQLTAGTALDIRENINMLLRKPSVRKVFKTKKVLGDIKGQIDSFLKSNLPPELDKQIKTEITKYSDTINRKLLGDIINKNTKSDFAVNWDKVLIDAKKEGLSNKISNEVVPILKEFSKRFHNDKYLGNVISPESVHQNLNALGVWSKVVMETLNFANDMTFGIFAKSRYKDQLIVKAIRNSIKHSDTPLGFVEDLVKKNVITPENGNALKVKLLEYKPDLPPTGDVNVQPIHTTPKGTAGTPDQVSKLPLKDAQDELIKNFVKDPMKAEDVSKTLDTFINSKRLDEQLKTSAARMKVGETQKNMEMLHKIFTNETNTIVKNIEKTHGIKVPPEEVDKILKIKAQQLLEECNK